MNLEDHPARKRPATVTHILFGSVGVAFWTAEWWLATARMPGFLAYDRQPDRLALAVMALSFLAVGSVAPVLRADSPPDCGGPGPSPYD